MLLDFWRQSAVIHKTPPAAHLQYGFTHITTFEDAVGIDNRGIDLVEDIESGQYAICKTMHSGLRTLQEARNNRAVSGHPNITRVLKFVPCSSYAPPCMSVPQCKGDAICPAPENDLLYLEYYRGGTLRDLVRHYQKLNRTLPELFIFEVLETLLKALCYTHLGIFDTSRCEDIDDDWDPLYHNDIRNSNIFLATGLHEKSPVSGYPRIILGDFSRSYRESQVARPPGIARYPELNHSIDKWRTDSRKDIFGMMVVVVALMLFEDQPYRASVSELAHKIKVYDHNNSKELRDIVLNLLHGRYKHPYLRSALVDVVNAKTELLEMGKLKLEALDLPVNRHDLS